MKSLSIQKRIAAELMKCSPKKVRFDIDSLAEVKESITKADIRGLIAKGLIAKSKSKGHSRVRARKILKQKSRGLRKGYGSRKGTSNARQSIKEDWINSIRKQRAFLKMLRDKSLITTLNYRMLLNKAKGGYFRSERHLKIYLEEHSLFNAAQKNDQKKPIKTK